MNRLTYEERKKANKIRSKLLYTIDRDIRENKKKNKNNVLINSMTLQELEDKFLLIQDYKMKLSITFTKIANNYMVIQTVDKNLKKNFYYTDYLQDQKKVNHCKIKLERKRISANNIIKLPLLADPQEIQSPEIFANKVNIGEKKLIKPKEVVVENFPKNSSNNNNNTNYKTVQSNENDGKKIEENNKLKIDNITIKDKKSKKINVNEDDSSIYSLTLELIQKKANLLTGSLNNNNKKELKRRKNQLEAIRKLRQFCFQYLRNKRRCITKSSHQNLLYITKFDEEDEKNNSNYSSKNKRNNRHRNSIKLNSKNVGYKNSKNNSRKRNESINESKKKKTPKKIKDKKKLNNSSTKKIFTNNSSKKIPLKIKRATTQRRSLVIHNNLITGKLENDILRFKKKKKEKNLIISPIDIENNIYTTNQPKILKKRTGILRESFKDKSKIMSNYKNNIFISALKNKNKNNNVNFIDQIKTKRNSSSNNFFNRKYRSKLHNTIYSSRNLVKQIKQFKFKKESRSGSDKRRRYSSPDKQNKNNEKDKKEKKESKSEKSVLFEKYNDLKIELKKSCIKNCNTEKFINNKGIKSNINWNLGKKKFHNAMQKVLEEDD